MYTERKELTEDIGCMLATCIFLCMIVCVHSAWGWCVCTVRGVGACAQCMGLVCVHSAWGWCMCTVRGVGACAQCVGLVHVHTNVAGCVET